MEDLEFHWRDRRGRDEPGPDARSITSLPDLLSWAGSGRLRDGSPRAYVTIVGSGRNEVYQRIEQQEGLFDPPGAVRDVRGVDSTCWISGGVPTHFASCLRTLGLPSECREPWRFSVPLPEQRTWEVLWGLVLVRDFFLPPELQELADNPHSSYAILLALLREAQFQAVERGVEGASIPVRALVAWLERTPREDGPVGPAPLSDDEAIRVLLTVLVLAQANGLLGRVVLAFDQLESVATERQAEEIVLLLDAVSESGIGEAIGILLGWRGAPRDVDRLRGINEKFYDRLVRSEVRL